jgi:hypothetical protein
VSVPHRQPVHRPRGKAEAFHRAAEALQAKEGLFLGDAFSRIREQEPELYAQWYEETAYPEGARGLAIKVRAQAAILREPQRRRDKDAFRAFAASLPFRQLHEKLRQHVAPPPRRGRRLSLKGLQAFHHRLCDEAVHLSIADFNEILDRLRDAADRAE